MSEIIDSIKHPLVTLARSLTSAVGRKQARKTLLMGMQAIDLALADGAALEVVFFDEENIDAQWLQKLKKSGVPCRITTPGVLRKMSETVYLVSVIALAALPEPKEIRGEFALMLDRVVDHGNLGTIIRTARAFGIKDFLTTSEIDIFYKKIIEASRALVFGSNVVEQESPRDALKYAHDRGYYIIATSPRGRQLQSMVQLPQQPIMLVLGNETEGVSEEVLQEADLIMQIPMPVQVESLNVGVFAGISMYELKLKQVLAMLKGKIQSSLGRDLGVTVRFMRAVFDAELKKISALSSLQVILLMIVSSDKITPRDDAMREMGIYGDAFDDMVMPLAEKGYLIDGDFTLEITDKGEQMLAQLWPVQEKTEELLLKGVSEEDKKLLQQVLKIMQDNAVSLLHKEK